MNRSAALFAMLLLGLVGCSAGPSPPPQWSVAEPEQYPASRYLTAVGEGASREVAEQRALAALARIFEVKINEQSSDFSLFRSSTGQQSQSRNRQVNSRHLVAGTEQQIEGAEPVEYWQQQQRHLVLVALERAGAEQRLRRKISQLDQQTDSLNRYADKTQLNPVVRISALEQARQMQLQRGSLNRNLSVVSGNQVAPTTLLAMLQQRIRDQLSDLTVQLAGDKALLPVLQHAAGQVGAQVLADAELQLSGRMDREPVTQQQGWYWLRGSLQLALSDSDGKVIAQQRWPVKVSAQQTGMIEQRLKDTINADVADRLYRLLTSSQINVDP